MELLVGNDHVRIHTPCTGGAVSGQAACPSTTEVFISPRAPSQQEDKAARVWRLPVLADMATSCTWSTAEGTLEASNTTTSWGQNRLVKKQHTQFNQLQLFSILCQTDELKS